MEINCIVDETEDGEGQPALSATCTRCGNVTESRGIEEQSERRCLVLMREECPRGESNFYVRD